MGIFDKLKSRKKKEKKEEPQPQTKVENPAVIAESKPVNRSVIVRPWISEKARDKSGQGKYVFLVTPQATKNSVRKEVETRWGVQVLSVNMQNQIKRRKRFRGQLGKEHSFKKATVSLSEGQKIDIYPV